jgi:hypothetical protein
VKIAVIACKSYGFINCGSNMKKKTGKTEGRYFLTQTGALVWVRSGRNSAWTMARAASQVACELNS